MRRWKAEENCALLRENIKAELEGMAAEREEATDVERLWNVVKEGVSKAAIASLRLV